MSLIYPINSAYDQRFYQNNTPFSDLILLYLNHKISDFDRESLLTGLQTIIFDKTHLIELFFTAVKKKDIDIVSALINVQKIDVNSIIDENKITALFYSCELNDTDMTELLLKNGLDINLKNANKDTALIHASYYSNAQMINLLISYGALVTEKNLDESSALMFAISSLSLEKTKILIDNGAIVDDCDKEGISILMQAILQIGDDLKESNLEILNLLLDKTQNIDAQDILGETALMKTKNYTIAQLLLNKNASLAIRDLRGHTPLLVAAERGFKDLIDLYLKNGADIIDKNKDGWIALMLAAQKEEIISTLETLLNKSSKKNINYKNDTGLNALKVAIFNKNIKAIKLLIKNGAIFDDKENMDPSLSALIASNKIEIIKSYKEGNLLYTLFFIEKKTMIIV